jgi:hypothetical protein
MVLQWQKGVYRPTWIETGTRSISMIYDPVVTLIIAFGIAVIIIILLP